MRKNQEINQAVAILQKKGDRLSLIQAEILTGHRSEVWVFGYYVRDVSEKNRDESVYCAARDAAMFLSGKIELEELIPDANQYNSAPSVEIVSVPADLLQALINRIESLEKKIDTLVPTEPKRIAYLNKCDASKSDHITQEKAYKYIGCSKSTLNSWTSKGLVKGYRKGPHVYYSQSELDANSTVQNFKNINHKP